MKAEEIRNSILVAMHDSKELAAEYGNAPGVALGALQTALYQFIKECAHREGQIMHDDVVIYLPCSLNDRDSGTWRIVDAQGNQIIELSGTPAMAEAIKACLNGTVHRSGSYDELEDLT